MVDSISKKAKGRLVGLSRVRRFLDSANMKVIYEMFIQFIMKYGSVALMGAVDSHLNELDMVQRSAESIHGHTSCSKRGRSSFSRFEVDGRPSQRCAQEPHILTL